MNKALHVVIGFAFTLAAAPVFAQNTSTTPPAQTSPNQVATAPAPAEPKFPAPTAADEARCKGKIPEGGVPNFLRSETEEQRKTRIGTEDPGCDPDPAKVFYRYG
ncbi:MAG TPA: hypothetical protein VF980_10965, partial [Thermoanaerobaculia bacterium]